MKKPLLIVSLLLCGGLFAQEHYSGISTSKRTGLLNANLNPAELTNLQTTFEVNILNVSAGIANNKVSFGDLVGGNNDFEDMLFSGREPVNLRADVKILGPAFAYKVNKWAFAISSSANVKANIVDLNTDLGSAVTFSGLNAILGSSQLNISENQRVSATTWGEIGFSVARDLYEDDTHKFSAGVNFNLLFPGSYANMSAKNLDGVVTNVVGDVDLTNATAELNFAYSGSLAEGFTNSDNFNEFFAGGLNGFSTDIGANYQLKDAQNDGGYLINAGVSVKNLGSMTFKDENNVSNSYLLDTGNGSLDLNQFEDVDNIEEIEDLLLASGYVTLNQTSRDFKVKLPSYLALYADFKIHNNWYATGYIQQKLKKDDGNDQIAVQNIVTVTPRYSASKFEAFIPLSINEISDFTAGIGFRYSGFFIGSGSILSAAITDTNQADAYLGYRIGF
ncbi:hypothetical protein [Flavobacterium subsaxonicum]|uniref:DUF5723 domain-containing protein n=1 Tax=Flavobacterium subsaxonicum WB 4.1-42 = DSM 21790 TaxID=1121898 RepID=A0A0A2N2R8_9FLAO|nr:hypothetical protein [Flavobacterium subsaxonicum]KGO94740.1 hypothetical protein Q766_01100 [Flavobacterium subsaxonicum WB 4.1-42 = DSM 21790]